MNKIIPAVWLTLLALALIYPIRYYGFADKTPEPPPEFVACHEATGRYLPRVIAERAVAYKCKGFIIPVEEVEKTADIPDLPFLLDDVNIALAGYDGWRLRVSDEARKRMIRRHDELFKKWKPLHITDDIGKALHVQKTTDLTTNYSADLILSPLPGNPAADVRLLLVVNDERTHSRVFDVAVDFLHPDTAAARLAAHEARIRDLAVLESRAMFARWPLAGLLLLGFLTVTARAGVKGVRLRREKQYREFLLAEINKREELINEGHYVTALELADKYLAVFPHDTGITAFRRRLLDFTNQDPEMAQRAFVEHKKLLARLRDPSAAAAGALLSREEREQITPLLDYLPELRNSYGQIRQIEDNREKERREEAARELAGVFEDLRTGNLSAAREKSRRLLASASASEETAAIARRLEAPAGTVFTFSGVGPGSPDFTLFLRDHLVIGRPDEGVIPDIAYDDRRVSRRHLEIYKKGDTVTARDLGSAGGSFVNGQKLEPGVEAALAAGDVITLGKIFDLRVDIGPDDNGGSGSGGLALTGDDRRIMVLFSTVCFDITPAGPVLPGRTIRARRLENILVITVGEDCLVPAHSDEIRLRDNQYRMEVSP